MIMSTKTIYSTATTRFDLSAAALHILAMALMLMDHLWATPVSYTHLTLPTKRIV